MYSLIWTDGSSLIKSDVYTLLSVFKILAIMRLLVTFCLSSYFSFLGRGYISYFSCCCDKYLAKETQGRKGLFPPTVVGEVMVAGTGLTESMIKKQLAMNVST